MAVEQRAVPSAAIEAAIDDLRSTLSGQLIAPGDPAYDAARRVHNGMIDRFPRAIARCRDVADVIAAVAFGRGPASTSPSGAAATTRPASGQWTTAS